MNRRVEEILRGGRKRKSEPDVAVSSQESPNLSLTSKNETQITTRKSEIVIRFKSYDNLLVSAQGKAPLLVVTDDCLFYTLDHRALMFGETQTTPYVFIPFSVECALFYKSGNTSYFISLDSSGKLQYSTMIPVSGLRKLPNQQDIAESPSKSNHQNSRKSQADLQKNSKQYFPSRERIVISRKVTQVIKGDNDKIYYISHKNAFQHINFVHEDAGTLKGRMYTPNISSQLDLRLFHCNSTLFVNFNSQFAKAEDIETILPFGGDMLYTISCFYFVGKFVQGVLECTLYDFNYRFIDKLCIKADCRNITVKPLGEMLVLRSGADLYLIEVYHLKLAVVEKMKLDSSYAAIDCVLSDNVLTIHYLAPTRDDQVKLTSKKLDNSSTSTVSVPESTNLRNLGIQQQSQSSVGNFDPTVFAPERSSRSPKEELNKNNTMEQLLDDNTREDDSLSIGASLDDTDLLQSTDSREVTINQLSNNFQSTEILKDEQSILLPEESFSGDGVFTEKDSSNISLEQSNPIPEPSAQISLEDHLSSSFASSVPVFEGNQDIPEHLRNILSPQMASSSTMYDPLKLGSCISIPAKAANDLEEGEIQARGAVLSPYLEGPQHIHSIYHQTNHDLSLGQLEGKSSTDSMIPDPLVQKEDLFVGAPTGQGEDFRKEQSLDKLLTDKFNSMLAALETRIMQRGINEKKLEAELMNKLHEQQSKSITKIVQQAVKKEMEGFMDKLSLRVDQILPHTGQKGSDGKNMLTKGSDESRIFEFIRNLIVNDLLPVVSASMDEMRVQVVSEMASILTSNRFKSVKDSINNLHITHNKQNQLKNHLENGKIDLAANMVIDGPDSNFEVFIDHIHDAHDLERLGSNVLIALLEKLTIIAKSDPKSHHQSFLYYTLQAIEYDSLTNEEVQMLDILLNYLSKIDTLVTPDTKGLSLLIDFIQQKCRRIMGKRGIKR